MAKKAATKTKKPLKIDGVADEFPKLRKAMETPQDVIVHFARGLSDEVKQLVLQEAHDKALVQQNEHKSRLNKIQEAQMRVAFEPSLFPCGMGNPVQPENSLPEIPQQVKELYQSSERLCIKVAELEKALESVLKGAAAIVKAEPKDAYSPIGRDLSQLNAWLSGLNETVETITLRLAI